MKTNSFPSLLQRFFLERLVNQMNASPCTVSSYRDTFRLFLKFMKTEKQCSSEQITLEMVNAETIIGFLNYLETARNNSIKTRNNRLAAVHSFMSYVSYQAPEYLSIVQRVMSIPFKKTETRTIDYLTKEEVESLLSACNLKNRLGRRDHVMFAILYNTGMRVSELIAIQKKDIGLHPNRTGSIKVMGKGRKERTIPIWKTTQGCLSEYLKEMSTSTEAFLFTSQQGEKLTRSGVAYRLNNLVSIASEECPSLLKKQVTPHVFRHTTAMHLLEAGIDISTISLWLGHESIETTHKYMRADLRLKEQALAQVKEPSTAEFRYQPSTDILSFLDKL